jgi:hypothetical protein
MSADGSEYPALASLGRVHPTIDSLFDPDRHRHRPYMSTLLAQTGALNSIDGIAVMRSGNSNEPANPKARCS